MSIQAVAWAIEARVGSPTLKCILMAVANYANEEGRCWPSQERLAHDTEMTERSVRDGLKKLEEQGFIIRSARYANGSRRVDMIQLSYRKSLPVGHEQDTNIDGFIPENDDVHTGKSQQFIPEGRSGEPLLEPSENHQSSSGKPDKPSSNSGKGKVVRFEYPGEFEMWWAEYPRHKGVSKIDAYKEWKKLPEVDRDAALEGAITFAEQCRKDKTEERFILWPCRWLKRRIWETLLEVAQ